MIKDDELEKLNIEPDKIILILLKHLMYLKNENAFLKNNAALHSLDNGSFDNKIGGKFLPDGISVNKIGGNTLPDGTIKNMFGGNTLPDGTSENKNGVNTLLDGTSENKIGGNTLPDGTSENKIGGNTLNDDTSENKIGGKDLNNDASGNNIGGKDISEALSKLNSDSKGGALVYSIFEKELLKALEYYIKNGDGQNTLFTFYNEFLDAIEEQNSASSKLRDAAANARLEDTHSLPARISTDPISFAKLQDALQGHLPRTARWDLYATVAHELLLLHNAGKATSAELRGFGGLSVDGFEKHLTKLMSYGLVKKLPPSNYVLTEKSNFILLQLFGIPIIKESSDNN